VRQIVALVRALHPLLRLLLDKASYDSACSHTEVAKTATVHQTRGAALPRLRYQQLDRLPPRQGWLNRAVPASLVRPCKG
jgi:hypothetical protein